MLDSFHFLSPAEFEDLAYNQKLAYLSDAMEELQRVHTPEDVRGWGSLFRQTRQPQ